MKLELAQTHFSGGVGDFDIGHVLTDTEGTEIKIVQFTGYSEIDEADGTENETNNVHFSDGSVIDADALDRAVFITRSGTRLSLLIGLLRQSTETQRTQAEIEEQRKAKIEAERKGKGKLDLLAEIKTRIPTRPIDAYTDQELMAKISGAPLTIAEDVMIAYEGNLARMAGSTAKQMQKISGIGAVKSEKITAAFELGKRLARFHATKEKITSPADVADLMMSKMRYLQKEIAVVLALDTKGGVTSTGKAGELAGELRWGKMLAESTIFEGTLNSSVFHPREIFRFAIEEAANSVILLHNHPSGDPQPSQEDIRATKRLIEAGEQIGIKVLDHIIIGDGIFVSLKEENFI